MDRTTRAMLLVGRLLIAVLFLGGSVQKFMNPDPVRAMLGGVGLPEGLVFAVMVFNGIAAVALILGVQLQLIGSVLAIYCLLTSYFHWVPDDPWQMSIVVKNWAIAGGCLFVAAHGRQHPGPGDIAPGRR